MRHTKESLEAAAPDMYEVLTTIEAVIFGGNQDQFDLLLCVGSPVRNALCFAIAKAESIPIPADTRCTHSGMADYDQTTPFHGIVSEA